MSRASSRRTTALVLAAACSGCGARSDITGGSTDDVADVATTDATVAKKDAGHVVRRDAAPRDAFAPRADGHAPRPDGPPPDAPLRGVDARPDSPVERVDARPDARVAAKDAPVDAPADAASGGDAGCPAAAPTSGSGACTVPGAVCQYADWSCTCHGACSCGNPPSCQELGISCGPAGLPCDIPLQCGDCPKGQSCGGGGVVGVCAPRPDAGLCVPKTCGEVPGGCGIALDGCGSEVDCGACLTWGCTSTETCPRFQPTAGSPCGSARATCVYTEWSDGCCTLTFTCAAGSWSSGSMQCPE